MKIEDTCHVSEFFFSNEILHLQISLFLNTVNVQIIKRPMKEKYFYFKVIRKNKQSTYMFRQAGEK